MKKHIIAALRTFDLHLQRESRRPTSTLLGLTRRPIANIIDVGANDGEFATSALAQFPTAHVWSFEPLADAFAPLSGLAARSGGRLHPFNVALGEQEGELEMFRHSAHTSSSSLMQTTSICEELYPQTRQQEKTRVRIERLDDVAARTPAMVGGEFFVKIDVQGFEASVIAGGRETLSKARACILEVNLLPLYKGAPTFLELARSMEGVGLEFGGVVEQFTGPDGMVVFMDALFIRRDTPGPA